MVLQRSLDITNDTFQHDLWITFGSGNARISIEEPQPKYMTYAASRYKLGLLYSRVRIANDTISISSEKVLQDRRPDAGDEGD